MTKLNRVLVTGGGGFIGSHVAAYYAERGIDVTVVDNLSRAKTRNMTNEDEGIITHNWNFLNRSYQSIEFHQADIRDVPNIENLVEGHDGVVHTAGQVAVTSSIQDPRTDFNINAKGTFNILEAARKAQSDPAVVVASTNKVYGDNINQISVREKETRYSYDDQQYEAGIPESFSIDECKHTPYGVSKLAADLYVQDYARRNEVKAAAFRMSCIYGPRQFGNEDQGWVAHFLLSTLRDEPLTIYGDGKQVRDVLFVKDLVRAYDAFLSDPNDKSVVYNIGGGPEHTTSLIEFIDLIEEKTGCRTHIDFDEWREGDQKVYISDTARVCDELNWTPRVPFSEGIDRFLEWYETYGNED